MVEGVSDEEELEGGRSGGREGEDVSMERMLPSASAYIHVPSFFFFFFFRVVRVVWEWSMEEAVASTEREVEAVLA